MFKYRINFKNTVANIWQILKYFKKFWQLVSTAVKIWLNPTYFIMFSKQLWNTVVKNGPNQKIFKTKMGKKLQNTVVKKGQNVKKIQNIKSNTCSNLFKDTLLIEVGMGGRNVSNLTDRHSCFVWLSTKIRATVSPLLSLWTY
jgi:hypothetical protein